MAEGTLEFDGVRYPDGHASDPRKHRLDGRHAAAAGQADPVRRRPLARVPADPLEPVAHARADAHGERLARAEVGQPFGVSGAIEESAVDSLVFTDMWGRARRWDDSLPDTYTDGILVLYRGRRICERYFGALQAHVPHSCFSITKSYAATLCAALVHEGTLDENQRIPHWLPEMKGTAYEDATLRQLMDMQIGVAYSEAYADPNAQIWGYARAAACVRVPPATAARRASTNTLQTLRPEGKHGEAFAYKTVNTELMAWVMKRVTGIPFDEDARRAPVVAVKAEQDGYLSLDPIGVPMGGGGLCASLRDLARFGELMRREGEWNGRQLVPPAVVADIRRGSDPAKFAGRATRCCPATLPQHVVVTHNRTGSLRGPGHPRSAPGSRPRRTWWSRAFASHPVAASAANDPITLPALLALGRMLQAQAPAVPAG